MCLNIPVVITDLYDGIRCLFVLLPVYFVILDFILGLGYMHFGLEYPDLPFFSSWVILLLSWAIECFVIPICQEQLRLKTYKIPGLPKWSNPRQSMTNSHLV